MAHGPEGNPAVPRGDFRFVVENTQAFGTPRLYSTYSGVVQLRIVDFELEEEKSLLSP